MTSSVTRVENFEIREQRILLITKVLWLHAANVEAAVATKWRWSGAMCGWLTLRVIQAWRGDLSPYNFLCSSRKVYLAPLLICFMPVLQINNILQAQRYQLYQRLLLLR